MYVANSHSDNVSVISPDNYTEIHEDIPVGKWPAAIGVDDVTNTVYVANSGSDTISVISGNNHTKIGEDIPVGYAPNAIGVDSSTNTVYVTNSGNDSISVIDGISNKVVAGVKFNVYPFNSGYVECDKLASPTAQYIYVWSGTECKAKANDGFKFFNWIKNLDQNSSTIIKQVPVSTNPLKPIFDLFTNESEKNEAAALNITEFGTFTANFKEVPSPIPKEIWLSLFAISLSVIIPSILKWYIGRRQRREFYRYIQQIPSKYNMKLDMKTLNDEISELYAKGKINESQQKILNEKVSTYYNNSAKI